MSVEFLVKLRDAAAMIMDAANEQLERIAPPGEAPAVKEEAFNCLKFEKQEGSRLGEFEVAHKSNNLVDKWSHAYGVLRQSNATIKNRYHGQRYVYSYWLYGEDRIYRQKLKQ